MGECWSATLSLAVRFVMFATEASDGREGEGPGEGKLLLWDAGFSGTRLGDAEARMAGTLGEKSETWGVVVELSASAPGVVLKDQVST